MATCTPLVSTVSTLNVTSYASGSFTPAENDLLIMLVGTSTSVEPTAVGAMTDNQGGAYYKANFALRSASGASIYAFVRNQLAAAVAHIATFSCPGDAAQGCAILGYGVAGMTRTGGNAIRLTQTAKLENQSSGTTPAISFPVAALTGNPCIGAIGANINPVAVTPPSGWTEPGSPSFDTGYATPNGGLEACHIDSGFTGLTVTWGGTVIGTYGGIILELDTSALIVGGRQGIKVVRQAIKRASLW